MSREPDTSHLRKLSTASDDPEQAPDSGASTFERLVAGGHLRPARRDLRSLGVPSDAPHDIPISQALDEQRSGK